jgi:hypothetical protein
MNESGSEVEGGTESARGNRPNSAAKVHRFFTAASSAATLFPRPASAASTSSSIGNEIASDSMPSVTPYKPKQIGVPHQISLTAFQRPASPFSGTSPGSQRSDTGLAHYPRRGRRGRSSSLGLSDLYTRLGHIRSSSHGTFGSSVGPPLRDTTLEPSNEPTCRSLDNPQPRTDSWQPSPVFPTIHESSGLGRSSPSSVSRPDPGYEGKNALVEFGRCVAVAYAVFSTCRKEYCGSRPHSRLGIFRVSFSFVRVFLFRSIQPTTRPQPTKS